MSNNEKHPVHKKKNVRDVIIESIECEPGTEGCTGDPDTCPNEPNKCDKKLSMFGYYDDTIKDSVEHVLSESLDELTKTFTASARRWQMIMMPSLFAFIILATYGFFLIYSLTKDVGSMATEMAIGKDVLDAQKIKQKDILEALEGLPDHNQELAKVASRAIKNAVSDYLIIKRDPWKKTYRKM